MERIAVIGAGLIGRAWAMVFARAGHTVVLYDVDAQARDAARGLIEASLADSAVYGLIKETPAAIVARIGVSADLGETLAGADYVQENVRETVEAKREIFSAMDRLAGPDTILASSTSGITASSFTEDLPGRHRCLVAHPVNPPSVVPIVELVPAPWTDPAVVARVRDLQARVGQVPILVRKEIQGFIVNRLQGALLNEAFRLVEDGFVDSADLDKAIKDGLGLRWSFMGPFETIDLNAPGGLPDYCARYGPLYYDIAVQATPRRWEQPLLERLGAERTAALPAQARPARQVWRDRRLMSLVAHKRGQEEQAGTKGQDDV